MGGASGGIGSGTVIGGRYRLLTQLGRGGMAQVWRGLDQRLDREVAVKIRDVRDLPGASERFEREARTAAALTHHNIVGLHDAGNDDDVDYLVMELVEGETLSERIRRGPLPAADIANLAGQICDALAAAHTAGIVHRDIKPGNILVTAGGRVKVCDFGIACHDSEQPDLTSEMAVGTAQYMAPEQARGGPATPRTDLYGLGCVIYAMATGHPPFGGNTAANVAWQHLNQAPVPLASRRPGAPSWLDDLVASLLAKDPAQRPTSAEQVREMLPATRTPSPKPTDGPVRTHGSTAVLSGEPTVHLEPVDAVTTGRTRLVAAGLATFVVLAAIILVLTSVSASDMPVPRLQQAQSQVPAPQSTGAPPPRSAAPAQAQPISNPVGALDALRAVLNEQVRAGNVTGKALRELDGGLNTVARNLARGDEARAANGLAEFARTLGELRRDGRITAVALSALQPPLGDLVEQLPGASDD